MCEIKIFFNSLDNIFYSNSEVTGFVHLVVTKPLKARKIDINVIGRAKTSFEVCRTFDSDRRSEHYHAELYYIREYFVLWKSPDDTNRFPLGTFNLRFKFFIPAVAPSDLDEIYGNIKYFIRVNIDIPWALDQQEYCSFHVLPCIDLNVDSRLGVPVRTAVTEKGSCCCRFSPITLTVKLPKTGYVCGERIPFHFEIENLSSMELTVARAGLKCYYIFVAGSEKKYLSRTIVSQEFKVNVHTDGKFSWGPRVKIPIIIGTVPHNQQKKQMLAATASPTKLENDICFSPPLPCIPYSPEVFANISFLKTISKFNIKKDDATTPFSVVTPFYDYYK